MYDYTIFSNNIQDSFNNFSLSLLNGLNKVSQKFIYNMLNGILKSNSCHLTKIGRFLYEDISLKKTEERLSRNLTHFSYLDILHNNYINYLINNNMISDNPLFFVDDSDLAKPNVKSFEYLGDVMDGSNEHSWTKGYGITEIVSLYNNEPITIQSKLWSTADPTYLSKNIYLNELLDKNFKQFKNGTYIFDRGFYKADLLKHILESNNNFIIRLKQNVMFYVNGKKQTIEEIVNKHKGKVTLKTYSNKNTYSINKLSKVKVRIKGIDKELSLIISYPTIDRFETAYLLTNIEINNAHDLKQVTRNYFKRWKIEEFFRFKKQQFNFEDIRVRTLNGLSTMNSLLNYVIAFITMCSNKKEYCNREIIRLSKSIKKQVYFNLYRIMIGIKEILSKVIYKTKIYIDNVIRDVNYIYKQKKEQRTLFNFGKY